MTTLSNLHTDTLSAVFRQPPQRMSVPGTWIRRSAERRRLRREIGSDPDRIQRLEADIGLPQGTLASEMGKFFWQE